MYLGTHIHSMFSLFMQQDNTHHQFIISSSHDIIYFVQQRNRISIRQNTKISTDDDFDLLWSSRIRWLTQYTPSLPVYILDEVAGATSHFAKIPSAAGLSTNQCVSLATF